MKRCDMIRSAITHTHPFVRSTRKEVCTGVKGRRQGEGWSTPERMFQQSNKETGLTQRKNNRTRGILEGDVRRKS